MATDVRAGTVLKALLEREHRAHYRSFCQAYNRAARSASPEMVNAPPSRATFYRWLSGELHSLPHPGHRPVLAAMFPKWNIDELFAPWDSSVQLDQDRPTRAEAVDLRELAGVTRVFADRISFVEEYPPRRLFDQAQVLDIAGLSLNVLCQQYGDQALLDLLNRARVRLLFLDPDGEAIQTRNRDEGHEPEHLTHLTRTNLHVLTAMRAELPESAAERVQLRTYDETIRFNIVLVDHSLGIVQTYLPRSRGLESPTMVMQPLQGLPDLYGVYRSLFEDLWNRGKSA
ncbi:MAG: DUF5919 domain-containing protein [Nocardioides sp.]